MYVLNYKTSKYRLNTYHNTYHNTCQFAKYKSKVLACITVHTNTYHHVLACIELVFGMYEIMTCANTDQIHAFISICANTDPNTFTNTNWLAIQSSTDQYRPIQAPIQTNSQITKLWFSIRGPVHANTGNSTVKSCAPASTARTLFYWSVCQRCLSLPSSTCQRQQDQPHPLVLCQTVEHIVCVSQTLHAVAKSPSADSVEWWRFTGMTY